MGVVMEELTVKIKITVCTNRVGSKCDMIIEENEEMWRSATPHERSKWVLESLLQSGLIEWDYEEVNAANTGD